MFANISTVNIHLYTLHPKILVSIWLWLINLLRIGKLCIFYDFMIFMLINIPVIRCRHQSVYFSVLTVHGTLCIIPIAWHLKQFWWIVIYIQQYANHFIWSVAQAMSTLVLPPSLDILFRWFRVTICWNTRKLFLLLIFLFASYQGDVGCGKTVVAFLACMEVIGSDYQVTYYYYNS